ncbi:MAG TPA: winged helix-turn-helix domain-containing protein [Caldimonas sp.]|jgi:DNA-binding winged helix-turn-helix (wHTH) protein/TolB-like protein/tetratricopeptide (TPR) repeat protein|nr:winged helix-turn-helix domain-containing protein [Caldimonas sp.]HEX2543120.1 winged helix-turn-helix domain-containing protein [Caldimonas sp.]
MTVHRKSADGLPIPADSDASSAADAGAAVRAWRFDGFELDLRRGELLRSGGAPVPLRPKAEALLRLLLAEPGRLFSRDELIGSIWPATVVTDDSLVQCVGELRAALGDHSQHLIRTVPRRGYRLEAVVAPVFARPEPEAPASVDEAEPVAGPPPAANESRARPGAEWLRLRSVTLAMLLVALAGAILLALRPSPTRVDIDDIIASRSTVAVMPLVAEAGPPVLRDVAEAAAEAITAQLSTRIGMRGLGRASTAAYDGSAPPLAQIARDLKATHVVTGRVAPFGGGERIVMDVQLVAVSKGEVIWARRYEAAVGDKAGLNADVDLHVSNAMRNRGGKGSDPRPLVPDEQQDVADLTLMAWKDMDRRTSLDDVRRARGRFQMALRADPESVIALNGLAATYQAERNEPGNEVGADQVLEHERVVDRARKLAPEDSTALMLWGNMQLLRGRGDLALPAFEKASRLVPSYPYGYVAIAQAKLMLGRTDEVQALADRAVELGAGDTRRVSEAYTLAAEAALMRGEDERAYDLARRGVAAKPSNHRAIGVLAALDALAGRQREAAEGMAAFLRIWPTATVARYDELRPSTHAGYREQRARLYDGLHQAGMAER